MQTFHFGTLRADQIAFTYSPAQEAIFSLHVLADPKHHALHIPWVMEARRRLSPALKAEAEAFAILYSRPVVAFWDLHTEIGGRTFAADLSALCNLPPATYAAEVMRVAYKEPVQLADLEREPVLGLKILSVTAARAPQSVPVMQELLADPARSQQRFATFLAAYWEACLADFWPQIEAMLLTEIERRGRLLQRRGVLGLLRSLTPELVVDKASGDGVLHRPSYADVHFGAEDEFFLAPSYFIWPHIMTRITAPALIAYPVPHLREAARPPLPPEQLLQMLRAAGDAARLQILQLLGRQARSTRELASLLQLSEAAVSKHLKLLQEAGLVEPRRESYYVFYHVRRAAMADLTRGLNTLMS